MQISNTNNHRSVFKAHPEFETLRKSYNITASSFFRRSQYYGSPDTEFNDVINVLKNMFQQKPKKPKKILIAGIGNSQEPFSFLSVIYKFLGNIPLRKAVDMYCVDLQASPSKKILFKNSFYDAFGSPAFVPESFLVDKHNAGVSCFIYRVKNEIFKYLWNVYSNPKKAQWETRIQDAITNFKEEQFDIISINNTLGYISTHQERNKVLQNISRCLKKGGILVTDPYKGYLKNYSGLNGMKECAEGIFEK